MTADHRYAAADINNQEDEDLAGQALLPDFNLIIDYLRVIRRHWLVVIAMIILVVTGGFYYTLKQPKVYQATATIIILPTSPKPLGRNVEEVADTTHSYWFAMDFRNTQTEVITSRPVLEKVVGRLNLDKDDGFLGISSLEPEQREKAQENADPITILRGRVSTELVSESMLIKIKCSDVDQRRAANITNALVAAYMEHTMTSRHDLNREATTWLAEKVVDVQKNLSTAEKKLFDFEKNNDILAVKFKDRSEILSGKLKRITEDLYTVSKKETELKARLSTLKNGDGKESIEASALFQNNHAIETLEQMVSRLETDFQAVAVQYGELHPEYKKAKKQLETARKMLDAKRHQAVMQLENELNETRQVKKALLDELSVTQQKALALNKLNIKHQGLQFDVDNYRDLYSLLLKRSKETELTERVEFSNLQWMEKAYPPSVPIHPKPLINLMLSLMLGLIGGIALAFIVDRLDNKVRDIEDAKHLTRAPNLGSINLIETTTSPPPQGVEIWQAIKNKDPETERNIHPFLHPHSRVAEACRVIRTNLLLQDPDRESLVFIVTSALPQEGKSTSASILATSMASLGQKVLLMDTDLRHPVLDYLLIDEKARGISDWIVGEAEIDEIVHPTLVPGLNLVPCGPPPPNPTEILHSEKMKELIAFAERNYDVVICDTAPLGLVSDGLVMASLTKKALFVIDPAKSNRHILRSMSRQLRDINVSVLGFIFNKVEKERLTPYGYYRYAYQAYKNYSPYGSQDEA